MLKRKFLSAMLSATMIVSLLPISFAGAEEAETETAQTTTGIIADFDFDGTEDYTKMAIFNSSNGYSKTEDLTTYVDATNGWMKYNVNPVGSGSWGVYFGDGDDAYQIDNTKENIVVKTRFKTSKFAGNRLLNVWGNRTNNSQTGTYFMFGLCDSNGKLIINGDEAKYDTGYELAVDTWYSIEMRLNYKEQKGYVTISDDNGKKGTYSHAFVHGSAFKYTDIKQITLMDTYTGGDFYVDYLKAYDEDLMPVPQIKYGESDLNGQNGIKDGDEFTVTFENAVTEADMAKITIDNGAELTKTLSEDGKTVTATVSKLAKRELYTVKVAQIGFNLEKSAEFVSADDDFYLFRAEFDGKDGNTYSVLSDGSTYNTTVENGILTVPQSPGGQKPQMVFNNKIPMTTYDTNIIVEARLKINAKSGHIGENGEFTDPGNEVGFFEIGPTSHGKAGYLGTKAGKLSYGTGYGDLITDYTIYNDTWYNFKIKINNDTKKMSVYVCDDNGNDCQGDETSFRYGYAYETIDYIGFGYAYYFGEYVDYVRIYDASKLPAAEILLNGEALDGQRRVDYTKTNILSVKFKSAITEEDLSKITIDGKPFESAMLKDGGLTASMVLEGCSEPRTFHTVQVEEIGSNKAAKAEFRTADEGKYILKAEFDGYDDDSIFYTKNNNDYTKYANTSTRIKDGVLSHAWSDGAYRQLAFPLDMNWDGKTADVKNSLPMNVADKTDIKLETKIKWGAEGELESRVLLLNDYLGFLTLEDGCFKYGANSNATGGTKFEREGEPIKVERDKWYTISISLDFKNQKYCINIVREGEADVYSSPWISMKNQNGAVHSTINEICYFWHYSNSFAPLYVDYLRISDEKYGLAEATYGDGIQLDRAALVPVSGNTFKVSSVNTVQNTNGITLKEIGGETVTVTAQIDGDDVSINVSTLKYDTKYELFIPKNVFDASEDQTITFRTVHDSSATLNLPAEFAPENYSSENKLNVAYFGGSITANNGWRNIVENWFETNYGADKVNHIRASIGGTGSSYGRVRLNRDVASKNPDIVFVEFAVNDSTDYTADYNMESIVRTLNTLENPPVIIFVYTTVRNFEQNSNAITLHDKIAESYGIPVINIRDYAMSKANTDSSFKSNWENTNTYISADNTHPAEGGSELYGNYVTALLTANASKYFKHAKTNSEVTAVSGGTDYLYDVTLHSEDALTAVDDEYSFKVTGNEVQIEYKRVTGKGGIAEVTIDGVSKGTISTYYASYLPNPIITYSNLGEGEHTVTIKVTGKNEASEDYTVDIVTSFAPQAKETAKKAEFEKPVFGSNAITSGTLLKATINYKSASNTGVTAVIALYDSEGNFVRMAKNTTTVSGDGSFDVEITPTTGEVKAKAYVWNSLSDMIPFAEAAKIGF